MRYTFHFWRALFRLPLCLGAGERLALADHRALMAVNDAAEERELLLLTNQTAWQSGDGWNEVCPWGEHPNVKGLQVVTPETVQPMINAFSAEKARQGRNFRGVPIYDRHPSRQELAAGLKPLGRIMDMQARNSGLFLQRKLNKLGVENDQEGFHPFPSIGWLVQPAGAGRVTPVEIDHVAMCEHPNIGGAPAWTNSDPETQQDEPDPTPSDTMNLKQLAVKCGLPETATLAEIEAAIGGLNTACNTATTERDQARGELVTVTGERDAARTLATNEKTRADAEAVKVLATNTARYEASLQLAINEGRITPADKAGWLVKLATNSDTALPELQGLKPKINKMPLVLNRQERAEHALAVNEANDQLTVLIAAALPKHKGNLIAATNAVCADPANAAIVKAAHGVPAPV